MSFFPRNPRLNLRAALGLLLALLSRLALLSFLALLFFLRALVFAPLPPPLPLPACLFFFFLTATTGATWAAAARGGHSPSRFQPTTHERMTSCRLMGQAGVMELTTILS